jgi:hypothetical protein
MRHQIIENIIRTISTVCRPFESFRSQGLLTAFPTVLERHLPLMVNQSVGERLQLHSPFKVRVYCLKLRVVTGKSDVWESEVIANGSVIETVKLMEIERL